MENHKYNCLKTLNLPAVVRMTRGFKQDTDEAAKVNVDYPLRLQRCIYSARFVV